MIVTMDLIGVPRPLRDLAGETRSQSKYGLPPRRAADERLAHALRAGVPPAQPDRDGRHRPRQAAPRSSTRSSSRQKLVAVVGEALARPGAGAARLSARPGRLRHEPPPADADMATSNAPNSEGPGGPRRARAPRERRDGQAAGGAVRLRLPQHDAWAIYQFRGDYAGYAQQYLRGGPSRARRPCS